MLLSVSNMVSSGLQKILPFTIFGVIWENVFLYNFTNKVHVFFYEFELYNGVTLTIVVIGKCYAYFWQMLFPILDSDIH